jgi:hypothetical protein
MAGQGRYMTKRRRITKAHYAVFVVVAVDLADLSLDFDISGHASTRLRETV